MFQRYCQSAEIYCDYKQYFENKKIRELLKNKDVKIIDNFVKTSKSIVIVKINSSCFNMF